MNAARAIGPYVRSDFVSLIGMARALIEASEQPYPGAIRKAASVTGRLGEGRGSVSGLLDFGAEGFLRKEAALASRLAMARIAAAASRFREREGRLPESLEELGDAGRRIDPATGESFVLRGKAGERAIASRSPDPHTGEELRWPLEPPVLEERGHER